MTWPKCIPDYRYDNSGKVTFSVNARRAASQFFLSSIFYIAYSIGRLRPNLRRKRRLAMLVIRTDGLGDGVLSEPMLRALAGAIQTSAASLGPRRDMRIVRRHPLHQRAANYPARI